MTTRIWSVKLEQVIPTRRAGMSPKACRPQTFHHHVHISSHTGGHSLLSCTLLVLVPPPTFRTAILAWKHLVARSLTFMFLADVFFQVRSLQRWCCNERLFELLLPSSHLEPACPPPL